MDPFVTIEIGDGAPSAAPQAVPARSAAQAPHRARFDEMRELARGVRAIPFTTYGNRDGFAENFVRQAEFMADFTDDCPKRAHFNSYFPSYQMLNYDQLRTYFTWRTNTRDGVIEKTSLSYAFIYMYELINVIGCENAGGALEKFRAFRNGYREHDLSIDKYFITWAKDFHIYYLNDPFKTFLEENELQTDYPQYHELYGGVFELINDISSHDIRRSAFYTNENAALIKGACERAFYAFEEPYKWFLPAASNPRKWKPFSQALFAPKAGLADKVYALSPKEIYVFARGEWTVRQARSGNRSFASYALRLMESTLRECAGYRHKLSVKPDSLDKYIRNSLDAHGVNAEETICGAVRGYFKDANRIVVSVDENSLKKIRMEALETQERLTVAEEETPVIIEQPPKAEPFTEAEKGLLKILFENGDIYEYARSCGVMPEVLIDGVNTKAYDLFNDNVIEDGALYEEYIPELKAVLNGQTAT